MADEEPQDGGLEDVSPTAAAAAGGPSSPFGKLTPVRFTKKPPPAATKGNQVISMGFPQSAAFSWNQPADNAAKIAMISNMVKTMEDEDEDSSSGEDDDA
eukprot:303612_1